MNIAEILCAHAQERPNAAAIIDPWKGRSRVTTFAQLDRAAAQAAQLLHQRGLRAGDAVLVFHPMSAELYAALLGIFRLGLVAMFLDPSAGREHIERCCALHRPCGLIASTKAHLLRLWSPALRRIPVKFVIGFPVPGATRWTRTACLEPFAEIEPCGKETPALLTFTSGSTGQPKAAVRTHRFLLAQHQTLAESLQLRTGDVDLTTLPIVLLANLASGVTSVIPDADLRSPGAIDPAPVVAQIQRLGVVSSTASPAFFECLTRYCAERDLTLPGVRKLFSGGAPVFPRLLDQLHGMAPQAEVTAVYGSTEAEPIADIARRHIEPDDLKAMLHGQGLLAGRPVKAIRLGILRDQWGQPVGPYSAEQFAAECLPSGQPGEIVVSGEHVLTGYLHGVGDTETKFAVDGVIWHRTGDAGYLDATGRLWLLGRCSARIHDEHGMLYPFAAETAVYQNPGVKRAALVRLNNRRILGVEFYTPPSDGELERLKDSVAWTHSEVRVCKRIPVDKRHNAKIDYPTLYHMLDEKR
jgi:acyl-CoA synthetase (AMP-forming)/AMP-acid ligase II